jgi:hypothetical protein
MYYRCVKKKIGERRENIKFSFMIIIRHAIATVEPYTLGSTIAINGLRKLKGTLLRW